MNITRPIVLSNKFNAAAVLISLLGGLSQILVNPNLGYVGVVALFLFLAWAWGRELDPEFPLSAIILQVVILLLLLSNLISVPSLWLMSLLLIFSRLLSGTVTTSSFLSDVLLVALGGVALGLLVEPNLLLLSIIFVVLSIISNLIATKSDAYKLVVLMSIFAVVNIYLLRANYYLFSLASLSYLLFLMMRGFLSGVQADKGGEVMPGRAAVAVMFNFIVLLNLYPEHLWIIGILSSIALALRLFTMTMKRR